MAVEDTSVQKYDEPYTPLGEIDLKQTPSYTPVSDVDISTLDPAALVNHDPDLAYRTFQQQAAKPVTAGDVLTAPAKAAWGFVKGTVQAVPSIFTGVYDVAKEAALLPGAVSGQPQSPEDQAKAAEATGALASLRNSIREQADGLSRNSSRFAALMTNGAVGKFDKDLSREDVISLLKDRQSRREMADKVDKGDIKGALDQIAAEGGGGLWGTPEQLKLQASLTPDQQALSRHGYSGKAAESMGMVANPEMAFPVGKILPHAVTGPIGGAVLRGTGAAMEGAGSFFDNPIMRRTVHYSPAYATVAAATGHLKPAIGVAASYGLPAIGRALKAGGEFVKNAGVELGLSPEETAILTDLRNIDGSNPSLSQRIGTQILQQGAEGAVNMAPFTLSAQSPEEFGETLGTGAGFGIAGLAGREALRNTHFYLRGGHPIKLDGSYREYGAPEDASHTQATKDMSDEDKTDINKMRHALQGVGRVFVLPEAEFSGRFGSQLGAYHNGDIFFKGQRGWDWAKAHEPIHWLSKFLSQEQLGDINKTLLARNNPSDFASNYYNKVQKGLMRPQIEQDVRDSIKKLPGALTEDEIQAKVNEELNKLSPLEVDFEKLPDSVAPNSDKLGMTKQAVLEEMLADSLRKFSFSDITKNPDIIRKLQLGAGKMSEALGIPLSLGEARGILGVNPSYTAVSAIENIARKMATDAVKKGPTYGQPVEDPNIHFDTVKNALRGLGSSATDAQARAQEAIDEAGKMGRTVPPDAMVKRALTGKWPQFMPDDGELLNRANELEKQATELGEAGEFEKASGIRREVASLRRQADVLGTPDYPNDYAPEDHEIEGAVQHQLAQGVPEDEAIKATAGALQASKQPPPRFYAQNRPGQAPGIFDRLTGKMVDTWEGPDVGEYSSGTGYDSAQEQANAANEDSAPLPPDWTGPHPDAFIPEIVRKKPDGNWGIEGPNNTIAGDFPTSEAASEALTEAHRQIYHPEEPARLGTGSEREEATDDFLRSKQQQERENTPGYKSGLMITEDPTNRDRFQVVNAKTGRVINYSLPKNIAEDIVKRADDAMSFMPEPGIGKLDENLEAAIKDYTKEAGIKYVSHEKYRPLNEEYSKAIADAYEMNKHDPGNPEVQKSYDAFKEGIMGQYRTLLKHGYKIEPWTGEGQPYANSAAMLKDLRENKHIYYFPTEKGYGDEGDASMELKHPMLEGSGVFFDGKEALYNDIFRGVHDALGHGTMAWQFGPRGEYNAFLSHASTLPHESWAALANETFGPNSWTNFGPHMRNEQGNIIKKGEPGYLEQPDRPFVAQRANLLKFMPDGWMDKSGNFTPLGDTESHTQAAMRILGLPTSPHMAHPKYAMKLFDRGYMRVSREGNELWVNNPRGDLTNKQRINLIDSAIEGNLKSVVLAARDDRPQKIIWSSDTQFMPESEDFSPGPNAITANEVEGTNSRPVSQDEFYDLRAKGKAQLAAMRQDQRRSMDGFENPQRWNDALNQTFAKVQDPWGGALINPETGGDIKLAGKESGGPYVMSAKDPGQKTVEIPLDSPQSVFNAAMNKAKKQFPQLGAENHYLGVFRDDAKGTIDIDPAIVLDTVDQVESIGAHTRAIGGAYDFSTGNGVYPPHIKAEQGGRTGSPGIWDSALVNPGGEDLKNEIAQATGANPKERFYRQTPEAQKAITDYLTGKGQAQFMPDDFDPNFVQKPPMPDEVLSRAMDQTYPNNPEKVSMIGMHRNIDEGTPVDVRIDIPTFNKTGLYAQTIHERGIGKVQGYDSIVNLDGPISFKANEAGAEKVRAGMAKYPMAVVQGDFNPSRKLPPDINDREEWTPTGFNPKDHSFFYDKETGTPVTGGSKAVMIDNTAYVKDAQFGDKQDFKFMPDRYIGTIDPESGAIEGQKVHGNESHETFGFMGSGYSGSKGLWRYNPDTKKVYWWEPPDSAEKESVIDWLARKGQKVSGHRLIEDTYGQSFEESHYGQFMPETGPIEQAKKDLKAKAIKSTNVEQKFFGELWPKALRATGLQVSPNKPENIKLAAERAVADIKQFARDNPHFGTYYDTDLKTAGDIIGAGMEKPLSPEEFDLFRTLNGIFSNQTGLERNTFESIAATMLFRKNGNLDGFNTFINPATGNHKVAPGNPFTVSAQTAPTKIRSLNIINDLIKSKGGVKPAIEFLRESIPESEFRDYKQSLGYGRPDNKQMDPIKNTVRLATGQDEQIPRMFALGKKVGAYTLNNLGAHEFNTVDVWESRFIKSYFKGMLEKNTGIMESADEHDIMEKFVKNFRDVYRDEIGEADNSSLQATRWFYIIKAATEGGYQRGLSNDTISKYAENYFKRYGNKVIP